MPIVEEVVIEASAPPGHAEAVEAAFRRAGFDVEVEDQLLESRGAGEALPWLVQVGLAVPITAFFTAFASEAGKDAYQAVKTWVNEIWKAREGAGNGDGHIDIGDSEDTRLILPPSLPEDALDALEDLDWSEKRGDYLIWDPDRREWSDPTKRN
jgi:hypothetical protein